MQKFVLKNFFKQRNLCALLKQSIRSCAVLLSIFGCGIRVCALKRLEFSSRNLQLRFKLLKFWLRNSHLRLKPKNFGCGICTCALTLKNFGYGVRVLGRGARSKNKRQSLPASPRGSFTNAPGTHLERRMETAQSIRTRDNVAHSRVNHHQLLLGNKNILTGKELEPLEKANGYHLDIIGVSSTK